MGAPRRRRSQLRVLRPFGFTRRDFLIRLAAAASVTALSGCGDSQIPIAVAPAPGPGPGPGPGPAPGATSPFKHGVASGDPLPDRVILWTRATPVAQEDVLVVVRVYRDTALTQLLGSQAAIASAARDWTVKIDFQGLSPATSYYYQFEAVGFKSVIGRTRSLPIGSVARLRFGVVSCSSLAHGFFNAYRFLAARTDIDVVLHLGDYVYEYGSGQYGSARAYEPATEMTTLADYRTRHSQYKRVDADLQEIHRQHPFITVWDDHETADNSYRDGANNHTEGAEGIWTQRKAFGQQAYDEWMPIRYPEPGDINRIWRKFAFGDLFDLIMLDTRLYDRDEPFGIPPTPQDDLDGADRKMLGAAQMDFLLSALSTSKASWKFIGQQVMFGQLKVVGSPNALGGGQYFNGDQWDAYQAERTRIHNHLSTGQIDNTVVLTGDIHTSWAMDITPDPNNPMSYRRTPGAPGAQPTVTGSLAVEYVCTSVTSPGLEQLQNIKDGIFANNPHMSYVDLSRKGYMVFDVTPEQVVGEWWYVSTIAEQGGTEAFGTAYPVNAGNNYLGAAISSPRPAAASPPALAP